MPRIILTILAVILALIVTAVILVAVLLDKDKVLDLASNALKEKTGASLTVGGESELSLFPTIGVKLGEVAVTLPEAEKPEFTARYLNIGVALMPLITGNIEMQALELDGLRLTVKQEPAPEKPDATQMTDAELDAFYAKRRQELEAQGQAAGAAAAAPFALNVERLLVTDSQVLLVETGSGNTSEIQLLNFEANGLNLDGDEVPLNAQLRYLAESGADPIEVSIDGTVQINGDSGEVNLQDLTVAVRGATPDTVTVVANGKADMQRQLADLGITLSTGETQANGKLRYASFESPQIDADLHMNLLDPALLVLAGPEAATTPSPQTSDSSADSGDQPLPLDALRSIDTRAKLAIDKANFDGQVINNLNAELRAVDGVVKLNTLTGEFHDGKIDMTAVFNAKHNTAKLKTQGGVTQLNLGKALAASGNDGLISGSGELTFDINSSGTTSNQLIENLAGPIQLTTTDTELKTVGVQKMLCQAVALVNKESLTAELPATTRFEDLSAHITLADGRAKLSPLSANITDIALSGDGEMNLLNEEFSLEIAAQLSAGLEKLDPACRVNERLTSIKWPVKCKGNISGEPGQWCSVATSDIIADLATNEAKRKLEKEAGKLLDKLFK